MYHSWNGVDLENTDTPKYFGIPLDRTLSYKTHIDKGGNPKQPTEESSKF